MATKSEGRAASWLHDGRRMTRWSVGILAGLVLAGCGVGADEAFVDGQLVSTRAQALDDAAPVAGPSTTQVPVTTSGSVVLDPGAVALPQDPIPVHDGRPACAGPEVGVTQRR